MLSLPDANFENGLVGVPVMSFSASCCAGCLARRYTPAAVLIDQVGFFFGNMRWQSVYSKALTENSTLRSRARTRVSRIIRSQKVHCCRHCWHFHLDGKYAHSTIRLSQGKQKGSCRPGPRPFVEINPAFPLAFAETAAAKGKNIIGRVEGGAALTVEGRKEMLTSFHHPLARAATAGEPHG